MWRVSCHPSWPGNLLSLVFWPSRFFLFWQALQLDMNWQHIERTDLVQHSCIHQMHIPLIDNSVIAAGQHYCSVFVPVIYMFSRKDPLLRIGRNFSHLLLLKGGSNNLKAAVWLWKNWGGWLDQRGTGLSTPLTTSALSQFSSPKQQASYLQHFRADNIVRDAEYVRNCLVQDDEAWTVLGQVPNSFSLCHFFHLSPILSISLLLICSWCLSVGCVKYITHPLGHNYKCVHTLYNPPFFLMLMLTIYKNEAEICTYAVICRALGAFVLSHTSAWHQVAFDMCYSLVDCHQ